MSRGTAEASGRVAGSFRDPSGFVFRRDGIVYRQVQEVFRPTFELLHASGLHGALVASGLLIPDEQVSVEPAAPGAFRILRPEPVTFISYPYEWCFSQLRDAALLTLRVQSAAMDHGMSLRDASAYNVQFHHGRPVLIDTLSFEALPRGRPWVAYRQFCQHFLAPLALMSYVDVRLSQLLRVHVDGVPLDLSARLLPRRARLRPSLFMHLVLHARTQRRHQRDMGPAAEGGRELAERGLRGVLDSLRSAIERMDPPRPSPGWGSYEEEADHYSARAVRAKEEAVGSLIGEVHPKTVWDLGANVGRFSRLASSRGIQTVAFDLDPSCVETAYRRTRTEADPDLLPLVLDLANPSPAIGWANEERSTLAERGPADLSLALALIHHLAIGNNVPLPRLARFLAEISRRAIVEFVPKQDEKVALLLRNRDDVFPDYTVEGFERAVTSVFEIERRLPIDDSARVLYLLRRHEP